MGGVANTCILGVWLMIIDYEVEINRFRLEATFYEMALNYYSKQVKKIRILKV